MLFVCSRNRLRSPTAEQVFSTYAALEISSAGTSSDAEEILTAEMVEWADIIFVMEKTHRARLNRRFASCLKGKRVICLDIPDNFDYMQPELIALLETKVTPYLRGVI